MFPFCMSFAFLFFFLSFLSISLSSFFSFFSGFTFYLSFVCLSRIFSSRSIVYHFSLLSFSLFPFYISSSLHHFSLPFFFFIFLSFTSDFLLFCLPTSLLFPDSLSFLPPTTPLFVSSFLPHYPAFVLFLQSLLPASLLILKEFLRLQQGKEKPPAIKIKYNNKKPKTNTRVTYIITL